LPYLYATIKTSEKSAIGLAMACDSGLAADWENE